MHKYTRRQVLSTGTLSGFGLLTGCMSSDDNTSSATETVTPKTVSGGSLVEIGNLEIWPRRVYPVREIVDPEVSDHVYKAPQDTQWILFTIRFKHLGEKESEVQIPRRTKFGFIVGGNSYPAKLTIQEDIEEENFHPWNTEPGESIESFRLTEESLHHPANTEKRFGIIPIPRKHHYTEGKLGYSPDIDNTYEIKWGSLKQIYEKIP